MYKMIKQRRLTWKARSNDEFSKDFFKEGRDQEKWTVLDKIFYLMRQFEEKTGRWYPRLKKKERAMKSNKQEQKYKK